jgi:hypothetical protein
MTRRHHKAFPDGDPKNSELLTVASRDVAALSALRSGRIRSAAKNEPQVSGFP